MSNTTLTPEQHDALLAFAAEHGPRWKAALRSMWVTGRDSSQPNGAYLRQVRNSIGPRGLEKLDI